MDPDEFPGEEENESEESDNLEGEKEEEEEEETPDNDDAYKNRRGTLNYSSAYLQSGKSYKKWLLSNFDT